MTRARLAALAALASIGALAACGKSSATAPGVGFDLPASAAVFRGYGTADGGMQPYLAVANELRNDLTLVNADTGAAVLAPIQLRSLAIPVTFRPALVASASLGDEDPVTHAPKPDLLVAISGDSGASGESSVQLVRTWSAPSQVVLETPVGGEVLAAVALPNPAGTTGAARIALALSDHRVAVVHYRRSADGNAIELDASLANAVQTASLDTGGGALVQPLALAASDDGARVYAATRDPLPPASAGQPPVQGVAEIDVSTYGGAPAFLRALDARAPTRLVAFARLRERVTGPASSTASAAADASAFGWPASPKPAVPRVYAVLDESGCGPAAPIECGVAVLDPGAAAIVPDVVAPSGTTVAMPYLAPIQLPSRALAVGVSPPPFRPPASETLVLHGDAANPEPATYHGDLMRMWPANGPLATTGVAAVACEDGKVYFLDLGRWKVANGGSAVSGTSAVVATAATAVEGGTVRLTLEPLPSPGCTLPAGAACTVGSSAECCAAGACTAPPAGAPAGSTAYCPGLLGSNTEAVNPIPSWLKVTPGYTRGDAFRVTYQGTLPSLSEMRAEAVAVVDAGGGDLQPRLAMQATAGTVVTQVVRLWDPSLGVRVDDIVQIDAAAIGAIDPACVGTLAPDSTTTSTATTTPRKIFEAKVAALVQPSAAFPGGAVQLAREDREPVPTPPGTAAADVLPAWGACFDRLVAAAGAGLVANLTASILASDFVVTSSTRGHVDRIASVGTDWTLDYDADEDALAGPASAPSCPIVPWPATLGAMACDPFTCRPACEHLLRVRKARRVHHIAETCGTGTTQATACETRFPPGELPASAFPDVAGPALGFRLAIEAKAATELGTPPSAVARRGLSVTISTGSGVSAFYAPLSGTSNLGSPTHPNAVVTFDRSRDVDGSDYRFLVPYVGDWVLDTSPSAQGGASGVIR